MEGRAKEKDSAQSGSDSVVESIKKITAQNARASLDTEEQLLLFLQSWWSRTYNRPLKDPLLQEYTIEELLYEFYDRIERAKAYQEQLDKEDDKIEQEKEQAVLDWAEQEEKRELEALKAQAGEAESKSEQDPTKDPDNVKWMEQQIQQGKELWGENFGEDIEETFDG